MFKWLQNLFASEPTSTRSLVDEKSKFRFIHEVYQDGRELWYTEAKYRGLNVALFITTKVPFQTDCWTIVDKTVSSNQSVARHIYDSLN